MNRTQPAKTKIPDEQMYQDWENMRIELLHELQEGADGDVSDAEIDAIGDLVVLLNSWREKMKIQVMIWVN